MALREQLHTYLTNKKSPLANHVDALIKAGNRWRVDPRLLVAISGGESSFGTYGPTARIHNAWGWGPHIKFGSWQESIDAVAKGLRQGYLNKGLNSLTKIQQKWAPLGAGNDPTNLNSNWLRTNGSFYRELGGDPNNVTKGWRVGANSSGPGPATRSRAPGELVPPPGLPPIGQLPLRALKQIAAGGSATSAFDEMMRLPKLYKPPRADLPIPGPPGTEQTPKPGKVANQVRGALREAFYDPEGAFDEGHFIAPIGGHSDHVHISMGNPRAMLGAIRLAQKMGLHVGENPFTSGVDPVHTEGSFHYRTFKGRYEGKTLGQAIDVSGDAKKMARFYKQMLARYQ